MLCFIAKQPPHLIISSLDVKSKGFLRDTLYVARLHMYACRYLVAESLINRGFVEYKYHRYVIQRCRQTAGDTAAAAAADDDDDDKWRRSVAVVDELASLSREQQQSTEHVGDVVNTQLDDGPSLTAEGMTVDCFSCE